MLKNKHSHTLTFRRGPETLWNAVWLILQHVLRCSQSDTHTHTQQGTCAYGRVDNLTHACGHTQLCSIWPCLCGVYSHAAGSCDRRRLLLLLRCHSSERREKAAACVRHKHANVHDKRGRVGLLNLTTPLTDAAGPERERAHWTGSLALTDSLIFADVPLLTLLLLPPPPTPLYFPSINKISKNILFFLPLFLSSSLLPSLDPPPPPFPFSCS